MTIRAELAAGHSIALGARDLWLALDRLDVLALPAADGPSARGCEVWIGHDVWLVGSDVPGYPCGAPVVERLVFANPLVCSHVHPEGALDVCAAHFLRHVDEHDLLRGARPLSIEEEPVIRVDGAALCADCRRPFSSHAEVPDWPTFRRGCDGALLKL